MTPVHLKADGNPGLETLGDLAKTLAGNPGKKREKDPLRKRGKIVMLADGMGGNKSS